MLTAQAQLNPGLSGGNSTRYGPFGSAASTNAYPLTLLPTVTNAFFSTNVVNLQKDRGLGLFASFGPQTNGTVTNIVIQIDLSPDRTNWTTTGAFIWRPMGSGTNGTFYTNILRDVFDNARVARVTYISAPTNTILSNIWWSVFP